MSGVFVNAFANRSGIHFLSVVRDIVASLDRNVPYDPRGPNSNSVAFTTLAVVLGLGNVPNTDQIRELLTSDSSGLAQRLRRLLQVPGWQFYPALGTQYQGP